MYHVEIGKVVRKQLDRLPQDLSDRLLQRAYALADNPRPTGCKKLVARNEWRIAVGDYRIIYEIHDKVLYVKVIRGSHRSIAYR